MKKKILYNLIIVLSLILYPLSNVYGIGKTFKNGKGPLLISDEMANILEYYFSGGKVGKFAETKGTDWKPGLIVISEDGNFYDFFTQPMNLQDHLIATGNYVGRAKKKCEKFANEYKVDIPQKEGDHIGPVISETQYNKIQMLIKKGIDEGAKLVAGGAGKPQGFEKGYFVKPTVFVDVKNDMEVARTEIFGPVLSVMPFENEEEAIKIANDTPYGLTNYIQTQDKEKVKRVARKLRSGMVDVNGAGIAVDAPFGGFKHSGIGREAGEHGLEEFLEVKAVGGWN